jgi:hypothetical protein
MIRNLHASLINYKIYPVIDVKFAFLKEKFSWYDFV